ncbi:phospholipid-binding protein [Tautonia sociabilis]|uniref:Phospholipid-binding protein n=1 Tax=Tautonia sociabilis TaxID=2080755 RepID=A0A432MEG9_9BACT|nr:phospholipid-binding protein [Tautonia sociabilis]
MRQTTHGRIRDLAVEEVQGRFVVRGRVPSYHTKQLALYAALELLPSDRFDMNILVS